MFAAKVWFFTYFGAQVCLSPYLNLYFRRSGFTEDQIGVLCAFRPWISGLSGNAWAVIADKLRAHRVILLTMYLLSTVTRTSLAFIPRSFPVLFGVVMVTEMLASPINIIVDAAVMAAEKKEGDYGKTRMWGAAGWGGFSAVAGTIVSKWGMKAAFFCNVLFSLVALIPTAALPFEALNAQGEKQRAAAAEASLADAQNGPDSEPHYATITVEPTPAASAEECAAQDTDVCVTISVSEAGDSSQEGSPRAYVNVAASGKGSQHASAAQLNESSDKFTVSGQESDNESVLIRAGSSQLPISAGAGAVGDFPSSEASSSADARSPAPSEQEFEYAEGAGDDLTAPLLQRRASSEAGSGDETAVPILLDRAASDEVSASSVTTVVDAEALSFYEKLMMLLKDPEVIIFFAMTIFMGFGMGNIDNYLFLYLEELGGTPTLMGLTLTVTCAAEVPVFFFTGWLLRTVGVTLVLHSVLGVFVLRMLCYTMLPAWGTPWAVLPIEVLHGVTFGCAWAAGTVNCRRLSPRGLEATTQAIFSSLYFGVGVGLGGLVGGLVYKHYGSSYVFSTAAVVIAAGWALCSAVQQVVWALMRRRRRRKERADVTPIPAEELVAEALYEEVVHHVV